MESSGKYKVAGAEKRWWAHQQGRERSSSTPLLVSFVQSDDTSNVGLSRRKSGSGPSSSAHMPADIMNLPNASPGPGAPVDSKMTDTELMKLRLALFLFMFDWAVDGGSVLYYFGTGRWVQGALTLLIVLVAGIGITTGFLLDKETRHWLNGAARRRGCIFQLLLYTPTFFPFFAGIMRLSSEEVSRKDDDLCDPEVMTEVVRWRVLCLKANWTETVFEAKPQLLLQLILLLESTASFDNPLDYLPVLTSVLSLYTVTNTIYTLVAAETKDETVVWSWLWGMSYTGVSVGGPALISNVVRSRFESEGFKFLSTLVCIPLYFLVFEATYMACYGVWRLGGKKFRFSKIYYCVLPLVYVTCGTIWLCLNDTDSFEDERNFLVLGLFLTGLVINVAAFWNALEFAETSFRLKNDKIDEKFRKGNPDLIISDSNETSA